MTSAILLDLADGNVIAVKKNTIRMVSGILSETLGGNTIQWK